MALIIAGFHRSGTSLLTQLLHTGGLFVGDRLLGAKPSNPYGHFEDEEVLSLHRAILGRHGDDWQWVEPWAFRIGHDHWDRMRAFVRKRELQHDKWGFKDPRVCLFMGAWKYLLPDAKVVVVYRDPGECVRSMEARAASDYLERRGPLESHLRFFREPDHGLRLWDSYNRALISFVREYAEDCLVLPFTRLTSDYPVIDKVNDRLGAGLEPVPTSTVFDPSATNRRDTPQRVHSPQVKSRVEETWTALEELAATTGA